ncbi:hypothetical protein BM525_19040 (plasmid) [Alteromonas mediterranea]|uniref:Uncharacterized protein n=1 Tax=Alteromonas mediterranea TaxID=314275 RepID=A0AAC9NSR7_9ALTE|nr:hypothetical protein [Alteromonas mediterranea]APD91980.1 hypothetical protein BM524_18845 [Alteromonas mediterranea]APD99834.1 hypothetical protein BM525_19040 [Alteromonas mediterranea]
MQTIALFFGLLQVALALAMLSHLLATSVLATNYYVLITSGALWLLCVFLCAMKKVKLSPDTSKTFMAFIGTNAAAILGVSFMGELPMPAPFSPQAALDFRDALAFLVNVITVVTPFVFFIAVAGAAKKTAVPSAT